jgi:glycosyltransferase involved in cell wall biosynthesis
MKTRILFIITGLSTGGAEMMLLKLLERLSKEHFEAHVISLTTPGELAPRIAAQGISVEAAGFRFGFYLPFEFIRLVRRIRSISPDIVHTWLYHADAAGGFAARLAGAKKIAWCIRNGKMDKNEVIAKPHGFSGNTGFRPHYSGKGGRPARDPGGFAISSGFSFFSRKIGLHLCALLSKFVPDKIVSCSQNAMCFHARIGYPMKKMVLIPNGFDLLKTPKSRLATEAKAEFT